MEIILESSWPVIQINLEKAREEFRSSSQKNGGTGVRDFMGSVGLRMFVEQVMQFVEAQEYNMFSHIVFDTAPTGHTLRLLSLPDFLDASIGKILKPRNQVCEDSSTRNQVMLAMICKFSMLRIYRATLKSTTGLFSQPNMGGGLYHQVGVYFEVESFFYFCNMEQYEKG